MTTPQGILADKIRSGELELIFCHPDGKFPALSASQEQRDLVEAALRQAAAPQGREALIEQCAKIADGIADEWSAKARVALENDRVLYGHPQITARRIAEAIRALTPAVAPDGAGEDSLRALVQELFDFTMPVNDADKFLALPAMMAESGWWKRAKVALALTPAGEGEAMQERIAKLSEVLARFHRNACYPDAMPHELYQAATEIAALAQAQEPGDRAHKQLQALWQALDGGPKPLCRDCADHDGNCPSSGLPCDPQERALAQIKALRAPPPQMDSGREKVIRECEQAARGPIYKEIYNGGDGHNWSRDSDYGKGRHDAADAVAALHPERSK